MTSAILTPKIRGLSLLELLMVLTLVGIILATGIPSIREYRLNRAMDAAVLKLQAALRLARNEALSMRNPVIVCPSGNGGTCTDTTRWDRGWIVFADFNGDAQRQEGEALIRTGDPIEDLTGVSSPGRLLVRFSPSGAAPASNLSILFCDDRGPEHSRRIVVSNSGRIRQEKIPDPAVVDCA